MYGHSSYVIFVAVNKFWRQKWMWYHWYHFSGVELWHIHVDPTGICFLFIGKWHTGSSIICLMGCVMKEVRATTYMHYNDDIMNAMASQIISLVTVYLTVNSGADQSKTSKLRVTGLSEGNSPVTGDSPHKGPVTRKMFPFDDVKCDSPNKVNPGYFSLVATARKPQ